MKNTLFALALFAFVGTTAFAQEGKAKAEKKTCTMNGGMVGGSSCCMKGSKTASVKLAAKPAVAVKL